MIKGSDEMWTLGLFHYIKPLHLIIVQEAFPGSFVDIQITWFDIRSLICNMV